MEQYGSDELLSGVSAVRKGIPRMTQGTPTVPNENAVWPRTNRFFG
jgi:hypothetical protein